MLDFITSLVSGISPAIYALAVAVIAIVWGFIHGAANLRKGAAMGQQKAELTAIKKDLKNANKIESAADAARANDAGMSATERLAASGRLRKPKDRLP